MFFTVLAGDRFLSTGNFSLISQNVAVWAVLGVGMTFVIITSGIDLSVGSVLVFSSVVAAKLMESMGGAGAGVAAAGMVAAVVSGMAWGAVNGVLVAKAKVPPLIVTLGTLSVALGLAQVLTGGIDIRSVPDELTDFSAYTKVLGIPGLPFVALIIVILGGILLHKTRFGRYTFAIGSNEEAARRTGIKVTRHLVLVYALAGTLAGVGAHPLARAVRYHDDRRAVVDQPQRHRRGRHRRHVDLRRRGHHLRHRRRPVHPCCAAVRVRHHRRAAVLAGRRGWLGAHRRRLRRSVPTRRRHARCAFPRPLQTQRVQRVPNERKASEP